VPLSDFLSRDFIVGDGANGTWLSHLGYNHVPYDMANIERPDLVRKVHEAYLEAGADLIETNTFGANAFRLEGHSIDPREVNIRGAQIAREAAGPDRLVLGAIGPLGKPIEPLGSLPREQVGFSVRLQAEALAEGGIDAFLLESYVDVDELELAIQAIRGVCDLPILTSKAYIEDGEQIAEGLPYHVVERMSNAGVVSVGANCVVGPQRMLDLVRMLVESTELPVLAFPTPGLPQLVRGEIVYDSSPDYFARAAARLVDEGAKIIGGCCGTTPEHIRSLSTFLRGRAKKARSFAVKRVAATEQKPLAESEPSELSQKLGHRFVTAVELDLPRGLIIDRLVSGAKAVKIAGADVVNVSDGARARLRMNPLSVATILQSRVGIEAMMHFSCRDRNTLAVQADLLGAHALGLRNILAITGDPANIGDYPSATSVFDLDAIGVVRILNRFNEGIDLAGNSVGVKCAFTIAVAFNAASTDPELEMDRLKRKADAGAHLVYTQPAFGEEAVFNAAEACNRVGLPVLVGVMPLKQNRHCEFLHNEVPGMVIPENLRKQMAEAPDDESAQAIGMEAAINLADLVKRSVQGIYLMPPFGNASIAVEIMEALR
jgi:homocysteine S-methyltransferase